ncbi:hypothetical protein Syun_015325 [Stephania yunnanensis]|uniref:Uncharacterized protein n=1 Tax=Stephania yunnanensis TaxID=152371 RepID=A0AAP0JLU1_9MAGN
MQQRGFGSGLRNNIAAMAEATMSQQQRLGSGGDRLTTAPTQGGDATATEGTGEETAAVTAGTCEVAATTAAMRLWQWRGFDDNAGNDVEQRCGNALPGRSIPDETTMDKAS